MSSDRAFRIPRAHKDRVHPRQLVAIAATCVSVGVALSGILQATHREPTERAYAWQSAAALQLPTAAVTETSISAATAAPLPRDEASPREPATPPKEPQTNKTVLVRGALSYRCEAAEKRASASGTCPPDRALEARVWRVLTRLTTCRATAESLGHADLKLWFGPGTATQPVFAAPTISPSLNLRAVSQCVATDLSKLRATRKVDRFELSLSFRLAARHGASTAKLQEE